MRVPLGQCPENLGNVPAVIDATVVSPVQLQLKISQHCLHAAAFRTSQCLEAVLCVYMYVLMEVIVVVPTQESDLLFTG